MFSTEPAEEDDWDTLIRKVMRRYPAAKVVRQAISDFEMDRKQGKQWSSVAILHGLKSSPNFPIWALTYWEERHRILLNIEHWSDAINVRKELQDEEHLKLFRQIPWHGKIPKPLRCDVLHLAGFLSRRWFSGVHIDTIGHLIQRDARDGFQYLPADFGQRLILGYRSRGSSKKDAQLNKAGQLLKTHKELAFCLNVESDHPQ